MRCLSPGGSSVRSVVFNGVVLKRSGRKSLDHLGCCPEKGLEQYLWGYEKVVIEKQTWPLSSPFCLVSSLSPFSPPS